MRLGDVLAMDLYAILEVEPSASADAIRRAYRRLVVTSHPDLNPGDREAAERRMVDVNVAASVLLDSVRRGVYDRACVRRATAHGPSHSWDPWAHGRGAPDDEDDWNVPEAKTVSPLEGELKEAVRGFRSWPTQALQELLRITAASSPSAHALFTIASVGLALFLIGIAKPRSLAPLWQQPTARVAVNAAPSSS
jgi:curved DNA-binding protein CbpA